MQKTWSSRPISTAEHNDYQKSAKKKMYFQRKKNMTTSRLLIYFRFISFKKMQLLQGSNPRLLVNVKGPYALCHKVHCKKYTFRKFFFLRNKNHSERKEYRERETDRQTDRDTERETDRQADRAKDSGFFL